MIDILPQKQKNIVKKIRFLRILSSFVGVFLALCFIGGILFLPTLITINSRYAIAESQMKKLEESGSIVRAVDIASLESRTRVLLNKLSTTLPVSPVQYSAIIRNMSSSSINLQGFSMNNIAVPILEVTGVSNTREDLQKFVDILKTNSNIALVNSPVSNFVKSTQNDFKITITFKK